MCMYIDRYIYIYIYSSQGCPSAWLASFAPGEAPGEDARDTSRRLANTLRPFFILRLLSMKMIILIIIIILILI